MVVWEVQVVLRAVQAVQVLSLFRLIVCIHIRVRRVRSVHIRPVLQERVRLVRLDIQQMVKLDQRAQVIVFYLLVIHHSHNQIQPVQGVRSQEHDMPSSNN